MPTKRDAFRRHARRQVDLAISHARRQFRHERSRQAFDALTTVTRRRDWLLHPHFDIHEHRHDGVEGLRRIAGYAPRFRGDPWSWPGDATSPATLVSSVANHVFGRDLPRFLAQVWWDGTPAHRTWFIEYAHGTPFRTLDLPIRLTRRMEHAFVHSPDDAGFDRALRRAEALGLGATEEWARFLSYHLARNMRFGAFDRPIVDFLVRHEAAFTRGQAYRVIRYVQHEVLGEGEEVLRPDFSMKGRTPASIARLANDWFARRRAAWRVRPYWRSPQRPMSFTASDDEQWRLHELRTPRDLVDEGQRMRHCVGGYASDCSYGSSRIWSLRRRTPRGLKPVVTIEVDPKSERVVEAFAFANTTPSAECLAMIETWAQREGLTLDLA